MAESRYFISYSSRDVAIAEALCESLENAGHDCWIAPRDVEPGAYAASIVRAIRASRALIFVASAQSAASPHVSRELERAVDARRPIVPVRVDDAKFSEEIDYYLAGMHWLDCAGDTVAATAEKLIARLRDLPEDLAAPDRSAPSPTTTRRRRRRSFGERLLDAFLSTPPPIAAMSLSVFGLVVVGLSLLLGIGEFAYPLATAGGVIDKEVGFIWAFNWSLAFIALYPAIAAVGLQTLREADRVGERLAARQMVVDADFRQAPAGAAAAQMRRSLARAMVAATILGGLFIVYAAWEFFAVVGQLYLDGGVFPSVVPQNHPFLERDWSVAALLPTADGDGPAFWVNFGFTAVVYLLLTGLGSASVFAVFVCFLAVAAATYRMSAAGASLRLAPDLRDPAGRRAFDPRCGFEEFEGLVKLALLAVLLAFSVLFLIHLQNLYLRAPDAHILDYVLPDLAAEQGLLGEFAGAGSLRQALSNLNSAIAYVTATVLFAGVVFGLSLTLRVGARHARALALERIEDEHQPLPDWLADVGRAGALERLDEMRLWPAKWPRLNHILLAVALAGVAFVFHRVGCAMIVAVLAFALWRSLGDDGR